MVRLNVTATVPKVKNTASFSPAYCVASAYGREGGGQAGVRSGRGEDCAGPPVTRADGPSQALGHSESVCLLALHHPMICSISINTMTFLKVCISSS